jgi:nicotinamidase-related amidase
MPKMIPKIVLGWRTGELLRQYDQDIPHAFIEKIHDMVYAQGIPEKHRFGCTKDILESGSIEDAAESGKGWVELLGVWEDLCILTASQHAISLGISVRIPKGYTFRRPTAERNTIREDINHVYNFARIDPWVIARSNLNTCRYSENQDYFLLQAVKLMPEPYQ